MLKHHPWLQSQGKVYEIGNFYQNTCQNKKYVIVFNYLYIPLPSLK